MNASTVTLHLNRLMDCCLMDGTDDEIAQFNAELPRYIERLTAALPAGVSLEIDETGTGSLRSLTDDDHNNLTQNLNHIEFWD